MKRLPKGFGSVYKLSGNRRKPYAARVLQRYEDDKPIYKYVGYYETKREALAALTEYNKNPYDLDLANSTITDIWEIFKKRKFDKISLSGQRIYNAAFSHLKPICDTKIKDLKTYQLQQLIDDIPRKWQTKSHVQTLLHQLFDIAIELDIVQKNYAAYINLGNKPKSDIHKMFTDEEIKALFDNVNNFDWCDTVLIMIYTGLRPSELLNIRTCNVHIKEGYIIGGLKTKAGKERVIPINNKILPFISKRYNPNSEFLIVNGDKPLNYAKYKNLFTDVMTSLNMDHLPHDCRHTFASMADTAGANKTAIKLIMGHASQDITERVYTHKTVTELCKVVNMF